MTELSMPPARIFAAIAVVSILVLASGCGLRNEQGSGQAGTVMYSLDGFDGIDVSGAFELAASTGDEFLVEVTVDDNFTDDLKIQVKGSTLHISFESGNRTAVIQPRAVVTAPSLDHLDISGASSAVVDGVDATTLDIDLSGASDVAISGAADELTLDASGSSSLTMSGSLAQASIDLSGASAVDLSSTTVEEVELDVSGSSLLNLGQPRSVTGDLSGASELIVGPDTSVSLDVSGASNIARQG